MKLEKKEKEEAKETTRKWGKVGDGLPKKSIRKEKVQSEVLNLELSVHDDV